MIASTRERSTELTAAGLAPYAARDADSKGRRYAEPRPRFRTEFQRDRDRIVHSSAFRRLVYKTQVFVNYEGDLYRTRLTHSLEVAQIGRTVARALGLNETLCEAICLAHDLGHTPFGHAGQDALNHCMRDYGGFEHNYQSLRVVDQLEQKYAAFDGLNLSFETREGVLKHCSAQRARTLGDLGLRFLNRTRPGLEAQLADLADAMAYNNHDVDDGLRAGLITLDELRELPLFEAQLSSVEQQYPALSGRRLIHEVVRRMIDEVVTDLITHSQACLLKAAPASIEEVRATTEPLLGFSEPVVAGQLQLKQFLMQRLYRHYKVMRMTRKAAKVVRTLFEAFFEEPRLMPPDHSAASQQAESAEGVRGRARAVADYIAGMTDRFAIGEYDRLGDPGTPS